MVAYFPRDRGSPRSVLSKQLATYENFHRLLPIYGCNDPGRPTLYVAVLGGDPGPLVPISLPPIQSGLRVQGELR